MGPTFLVAALLSLAALSAEGRVQPQEVLKGNDSGCQSCMVAVRLLEDYLCDPAAESFLVEFVDKRVCPVVGNSPKCHNLAQGLIPVVIQWLRSVASPAQVCSAAHVCGPAFLGDSRYNRPSLKVRDTSDCSMCKFVVTEVKSLVNDTSVQEFIKEKALELCASLPTELAKGCVDFVNTYDPLLTQFINNIDAQSACQLVGVCTLHTSVPPLPANLANTLASMQALKREHMVKLQGASNDACDYCKMAVVEAHSLISSPTVQQDIINYTKSLCESFTSFHDACASYVDSYAPLVFSLLEEYLEPDQLCVEMGMCQVPSLMERLSAALLSHNLVPQRLHQQLVGQVLKQKP